MDELQGTGEGSHRAPTRGGTRKGKEAAGQRRNWDGERSRRLEASFGDGGKVATVIQREERAEDMVDLGSKYEFRD